MDMMKNFACDINLPTTFLVREDDDIFSIQFMNPSGIENQLCGHGALCAVKFLYLRGQTSGYSLELRTKFDLTMEVDILDDGAIEIAFPYIPTKQLDLQDFVPDMRHAIDLKDANVTYFGRSKLDYVIEVDRDPIVRGLSPDFKKLAKFNEVRAWIVTARGESGDYHFVSRVFGPAAGINEDPVTGSAHVTLASHWRRRLGINTINDMTGYQASPRGGFVECNYDGGDTVLIRGHAVPMWDFVFDKLAANGIDIGLY